MDLPEVFHDPAFAASFFAERYRRPPPWFELVSVANLEDLWWTIALRLRMKPPSMNIETICTFAWEQMSPPRSDMIRGGEPLGEAAARLCVPRDGMAILYYGGNTAARLRTRDVIEFDHILWQNDRGGGCWLIDDAGDWIVAGAHDWPAYWLQLRRPADD